VAVSNEVLHGIGATIEDFLWMPEFRAERDQVFGHLVLYLRAWVLQSRHVEPREITMEAPATWFDHLKEHVKKNVHGQRVVGKRLWGWFVSKLTVRYTVHRRDVENSTFVCPHVGSIIEKDRKHLEFLLHTCDDLASGVDSVIDR
jgi:hypothetical protein